MRILLVEDDEALGEAVRDQGVADGNAVDWVQRVADAEESLRAVPYDLVLLDLMLPDGRGLDLLKSRRAAGDVTPVIILTARDRISDRIEGLNAGADDYLVKPFDLSELSARVLAVSRRYSGNPNPLVRHGEIEVDLAGRQVYREGLPIDLTAREWALFEALLQRPGMILSKRQLEDRLYAFGDEVESNTIEAHVSRLRKKLGRDAVETVRGVGYRLGRA
ncbi:response regulator [Lutibaculum baratangense]|uniref:DNA-binding response regulator n=1 Tax=Lutibaculum baratangense AMV1 TaxID=631454 RepID=V4RCV2_9HYPH|nr:response regulator transcription factor [Lutibaculum baratangense]ESR23966.1 DNA-binding response regulator [Lutibaculum baratangense AMV1]